MNLPTLSASQVGWIVQQVEAYISSQRASYRPGAVALSASQVVEMLPFFRQPTLSSTWLLAGQTLSNPPFYSALAGMGFAATSLPNFSQMAAITYVDTVVSCAGFTDNLLFHELVHVVQYEKLGLPAFAAKYVAGFLTGGCYNAIPLEMNAYQLEARFVTSPTKAFSVDSEVEAWITSGRL